MKRIDQLVATQYAISRSFAIRLIKEGKVTFQNNVLSSASKKLPDDTDLYIDAANLLQTIPSADIIPEKIDFNILYEDSYVLVIDKPPGMSVHTSDNEQIGTVVNGLVYRFDSEAEEWNGSVRPGIVHRLDKDTSGVLITAKDPITQAFLMDQFKNRNVKKQYIAIVSGAINEDTIVEKPISRNKRDRKKMGINENGKYALTTFKTMNLFKGDKGHIYTKLDAFPSTGRTHQIRVHLKSLGHPIVGDKVYGGINNPHMLLHSYKLVISIPDKGEMEFIAPVPIYFDEFLDSMENLSL